MEYKRSKYPELMEAWLDEENIKERIHLLYGENRDWNQKQIYYRDFVTKEDIGKTLKVRWRHPTKRIDTFISKIIHLDAIYGGYTYRSPTFV